jgi:hypothetical protein
VLPTAFVALPATLLTVEVIGLATPPTVLPHASEQAAAGALATGLEQSLFIL